MPSSLTDNLLAIAEIGSNQLLSLDDKVMARCLSLQGRCIAINITDLDFTLYCHPGNWGIRLSHRKPPREVDATISARLFALVNLSLQQDKVSTSIKERVTIQGDASVAQQMQKILSELDIDWEEILSQYTGDVVAYQVSRHARSIEQWLRQSASSLLQTGSEYMHEEQHLTPTRVEFDRFQHKVTTLKEDVERCEARLRGLFKASTEKY